MGTPKNETRRNARQNTRIENKETQRMARIEIGPSYMIFSPHQSRIATLQVAKKMHNIPTPSQFSFLLFS
jgi:hypothetical protein